MMDGLTSTLDLLYPLLCSAFGCFVFFVFKVLKKIGRPRASLLLPLAVYLVFWHSWIYQRFNLAPESFYDSFLGTVYWFAHDAVLFSFMGIALVPLLGHSENQSVPAENACFDTKTPETDEYSDFGGEFPESY